MPRRCRIGNAREKASASTYRAEPVGFLSRAKPQKSHAALQTLVTEKSQTAGSLSSIVLRSAPAYRNRVGTLVIHRIADDRAGHAMPAAAAAAQFGAGDRDDFDALLAQQRVGIHVAIIGEDHTR